MILLPPTVACLSDTSPLGSYPCSAVTLWKPLSPRAVCCRKSNLLGSSTCHPRKAVSPPFWRNEGSFPHSNAKLWIQNPSHSSLVSGLSWTSMSVVRHSHFWNCLASKCFLIQVFLLYSRIHHSHQGFADFLLNQCAGRQLCLLLTSP